MSSHSENNKEIFSFHLLQVPLLKIPQFLYSKKDKNTPGLKHSERFITMNLGQAIFSKQRYNVKTLGFLAWWQNEEALNEFLSQPKNEIFKKSWYVRLKLYRRWGEVKEIKDAIVDPQQAVANEPMVAITLARLNLTQTLRFAKWGKPVERQVRDHQGQNMALAGIRPLTTFCTFSMWKNENEMTNMVYGKNNAGESHKQAMQERTRKDFHHEFTTMRFTPLTPPQNQNTPP